MVSKHIITFFLISGILVKGRNHDFYDSSIHRFKRSVACSSIDSLRKYTYTSQHTACLSPLEGIDMSRSGVSTSEITEIVNSHNNYRASVNPTASDMAKLSWDVETAFIAQKWTENCQRYHDTGYNRRIPGRFSLGQNLAWSSNKMAWSDVIKLWYDEVKDFTYNGDNDFSKVGHYTQVVWAKSFKIGCGYTYCQNINSHMFACNYGPEGNLKINLPYKQGSTCYDCPGKCVNGICDCDKVCLNGGTLDLSTCTCSCISGYSLPDCSLNCSIKTDPWYCDKQYTVAGCSIYSNVPTECPHMCKFCPNSGISYTGPTDNKGTLVSFDPTATASTVKPTTSESVTDGSTTIGDTSNGQRTEIYHELIFSFMLISLCSVV